MIKWYSIWLYDILKWFKNWKIEGWQVDERYILIEFNSDNKAFTFISMK
jgi:hypothetical protein